MAHEQREPADVNAVYAAMDDVTLIAHALQHDASAEEALVRRYTPLLIQYLRARSSRYYEDVFQETFALALARLSSLRRHDRFGPWLLKIAQRTLARWARNDARNSGLRYWEQVVHAVRSWSDVPEQISVIDSELSDEVRVILAAIQSQPERYRSILYLNLIHEKPPQDIAMELGIRPSTVRMRLKRGLKKLRNSLKQKGLC